MVVTIGGRFAGILPRDARLIITDRAADIGEAQPQRSDARVVRGSALAAWRAGST